MADAIDELHRRHLMSIGFVEFPLYQCTNYQTLTPCLALSGRVEHRCSVCGLVEEQSLREYMAACKPARLLTISCPRACASVRERHVANVRRKRRRGDDG